MSSQFSRAEAVAEYVSGYTVCGTTPYFLTRFYISGETLESTMTISNCPPSPIGDDSRCCTSLLSSGVDAKSIIHSKKSSVSISLS